MVKAILDGGIIRPLDPLPSEWIDGRELTVEAAKPTNRKESLETWKRGVERLGAEIDAGDLERLEKALVEAKMEAKAQVRREMGLSC